MKQIPLDFAFRSAVGREDFLVTSQNEEAVAWIDNWPNWPNPLLLIIGPSGSGKSHLAHIWAQKSNAVTLKSEDLCDLDINALTEVARHNLILEDIGAGIAEKPLFHLYNLVKENGSSMLMTSRNSVRSWDIQLPDLKSRLGAIQIANIKQPDDSLFAAILLKLFTDRQIAVAPDVIQFLVMRLERSFSSALNAVRLIDSLSLSEKKKITIPLVKRILEAEDNSAQTEI
ncbi:HdaA/DnaA family protein [Sneathiella glossodoripedis]|uniref:HdaA/DnaA family protein n=1 Tax=Sneathiella glossodoripedis TaxID=418853 RepID=UPI000472E2E1|nr:DnaA/Hda family protein [Sneathiella glossodoripedis]